MKLLFLLLFWLLLFLLLLLDIYLLVLFLLDEWFFEVDVCLLVFWVVVVFGCLFEEIGVIGNIVVGDFLDKGGCLWGCLGGGVIKLLLLSLLEFGLLSLLEFGLLNILDFGLLNLFRIGGVLGVWSFFVIGDVKDFVWREGVE